MERERMCMRNKEEGEGVERELDLKRKKVSEWKVNV